MWFNLLLILIIIIIIFIIIIIIIIVIVIVVVLVVVLDVIYGIHVPKVFMYFLIYLLIQHFISLSILSVFSHPDNPYKSTSFYQ